MNPPGDPGPTGTVSTRDRIVNFVLYQSGWLCCVSGAAHGRPWSGMLVASLLLTVHVALVSCRRKELSLMALAAGIGAVADSAQSASGLLVFSSGHVVEPLAPPWIVVMWMQFATILRFGLWFLRGRLGLAAILGACGGPLAFWAGMRLGAVALPRPVLGFSVLASVWALACPLLVWVAARGSSGGGSYRLRP